MLIFLKTGAEKIRIACSHAKNLDPKPRFSKGPISGAFLRWLGTVLGRIECANFFVKTYCLWHQDLENEIILGGHRGVRFFRKWVQTLLFLTLYGVNWKTVTCLPSDMRSRDHDGDAKMSKKGTSRRRI